MKKVTKDRALLFSALVLIIYSVICEIQLFMGIELDAQLTIAIFATFGVAEGGYCAYLHQKKKEEDEDNVI